MHDEKYMCWTRNREKSNVIADIFLTHLDSVKLLNTFHLVLIFDRAYKKKIGIVSHYLRLLVLCQQSWHFWLDLSTGNMKRGKISHGNWRSWRSCSHPRSCFPRSWWRIKNSSLWMSWKLCSHHHFIYCVYSIFWKMLVWSVKSTSSLISKSILWIYKIKSCIQIVILSLSNTCIILR